MMSGPGSLALRATLPVRALNAGLFISKGEWIHSQRTIESFELIFVRQGTLSMREEDQEFSAKPGQTLLLWPGRKHAGQEYNTEDLHFFWVHFTLDDEAHSPVDYSEISIPQICSIDRPDRLTGLFRRFLDDQEAKCLTQESADLLVMLMLNHIAQTEEPSEYFIGTATLVAQRAEAFIRTNFDKPVSTSSIARALDYNPDYLGRAFRAVYSTTLTAYLQKLRLNHACNLLMDGSLSVAQVARQCGYDDPGYFRRIFHRQEGMSPMAYRRLYARVHINTE